MGRTPKAVNWETVRKKIEAGCTAKEIFNSYDCQISDDAFYRRFKKEFGCNFADYVDKSSQTGTGDLKLMLHAKAMQGNITSLIFLARCRCGLREPDNIPLLAANQNQIDQTHLIMQLQHKISELEASANKSKTE